MINKLLKNFTLNKIVAISFAVMCFSAPYVTHAASLYLLPVSATTYVGDTISIKLMVDTEGKVINSAEATMKFPTDLFQVISITKSSSIFSMWIEEPSFSNNTGVINISGGLPTPGFVGSNGYIVIVSFKAKKEGIANVTFSDGAIRENDGLGTDILTSKRTNTIRIEASKKIETPIKKEEPIAQVPVVGGVITISPINNISKYSLNKFLITSKSPVQDQLYSIQIDYMYPITWTDDGTHIFQVPELGGGTHTIKVTVVDNKLNTLSGFLDFTTTVLKVPTFTYYPTDLYVDQLLVLKGIADPVVDIELTITDKENDSIITDHVFTNNDGKFTYVPDVKLLPGRYFVVARATSDGTISGYTIPLIIINKERTVNFLTQLFGSSTTLLIGLGILGLIVIIVFLLVYNRIRKKSQTLNNTLN